MAPLTKTGTLVPNWLLGIVIATLFSLCGVGWDKIDYLEEQVVQNRLEAKFDKEKIKILMEGQKNINAKLDVLLSKVIVLETTNAKD